MRGSDQGIQFWEASPKLREQPPCPVILSWKNDQTNQKEKNALQHGQKQADNAESNEYPAENDQSDSLKPGRDRHDFRVFVQPTLGLVSAV